MCASHALGSEWLRPEVNERTRNTLLGAKAPCARGAIGVGYSPDNVFRQSRRLENAPCKASEAKRMDQ